MNCEAPWTTDDTRVFRKTAHEFIAKEFLSRQAQWDEQGRPDREAWRKAGRVGLLLPDVPEEYGGAGGTFAHEAVVIEELARAGIHSGFGVQSIVAHYILAYGNEEQRRRWLPGMAAGELIGAIGMTEPNAGSDVQAIKTTARREGDEYIVNGSKTFITNGSQTNLLCLAVRTGGAAPGPRALSLLVLETNDLAGYRVGRSLHKIGRHSQDTTELFFDDVRVPARNLLGPSEGRGLFQMMDQLSYERLSIAVSAVAAAESAVDLTTRYVKERNAFGKPLIDLQNTRFKLAECKTDVHIGRIFVDKCIQQFIAGRLDSITAAMVKYWLTECQCRVIDECVQLHGGYGYMQEYPIARMWVDSRIQKIYAGSNEIMKEIVGSSL
ncbi:acyl-CoA dehydrogenase [Bradyrhizobium sp. CCBAU 51745]|uniref:acyl-CoA dehydrogenase family protein n=1 Tax=Bradyrhizobium sp. CCBAU 51745 TaxID=1325099 RepID=UPI0023053F27|nr:acyl-CoA dehydrogenase family protein [Bradyrhizobium sp. CCBAU 51745]MDA9444572.1 acyl-CoA dehydrogenase [Bradyrhizobium sp. CCBAU 51745]